MNKEKWIDDVLASTEGMERANAPSRLHEGIMQKLSSKPRSKNISLAAGIAAAVMIMLINVGTVVHYVKSYKQTSANVFESNSTQETISSVTL